MKSLHWIKLGTSLLALAGWDNKAQAADIIVSFEATPIAANAQTLRASEKAIAVQPQLSNPDAHVLDFVPPPTLPQAPSTEFASAALLAGSQAPEPSAPSPPDNPAGEAPLPLPEVPLPPSTETTAPLPLPPLSPAVAYLFEGDENSVVAVAVGNAEGTRTVSGDRTLAYYGHVDPGNQVWNQGTFSYQHGARSPEEADQKQLARLKQQTKVLHHLAFEKGITLTKTELLNGIDLANQAPQAALDRGYIDWLATAKTMGLQGEEAILWARTRAFLDPESGRWNAPGLGNSVQSITRDQARRQQAIAQVIQNQSHHIPISPSQAEEKTAKPEGVQEEAIDSILFMDTVD